MRISLPEPALVVLVGPSGSGKSTFARAHFRPTEVLSSDLCRALVADDEQDQSSTAAAFDVLRYIAGKRLQGLRLTVVDATSVQAEDRRVLLDLAREHHLFAVAIVLDVPLDVCLTRNAARSDRQTPPGAIRRQAQALRRSRGGLRREGFLRTWTVPDGEEVIVERQRLWVDRRDLGGAFDIVGDVHGCAGELTSLLERLGYTLGEVPRHPEGRRAVFVGDLVDRGPDTPGVLRLVMRMVAAGAALAVAGNHDAKLARALAGRDVRVSHGLDASLAQLGAEPESFRQEVAAFLDGLVSHYVLDGGRLVVAHAGLTEDLQGRSSRAVRDFALYGETTGESDELGLPVRGDWAARYRGEAAVVYGHTPVAEPQWVNGTVNVDTGCVFGGELTALRYPERTFVSVPAERQWYEPARPFLPAGPDPSAEPPEGADAGPAAGDGRSHLLDIRDVLGKRVVATRLRGNVTIREERAAAALEVMSRYALDPRWLVYLPPTMAPGPTSTADGLLEHPADTFAWYREHGIGTVVCEEKHMGSRAVVVVCRDPATARRRFGTPAAGACYTRTARRFFSEPAMEGAFLDRVRVAAGAAGLWDELSTDWLVLDAELLPWAAKAQQLITDQYASVGAAARVGLAAGVEVLEQVAARGPQVGDLLDRYRRRARDAADYVAAYRHHVRPLRSLDDVVLAPFHLLASEGGVHTPRDHRWHLALLGRLADADPSLIARTRHLEVDLADPASQVQAVRWWEELSAAGGEGMVVKPAQFVPQGSRGLVQPALKVRGREYLRIVYGPEYTAPEHLARLRSRRLTAKRGLALQEFALGVEALERFARHEPLHRVHECVFAILALETEPVDPRL